MTIVSDLQLGKIHGGDLADWIDAGCITLGVIDVATGGAALLNPVGAAANAFCVGWGIASFFG